MSQRSQKNNRLAPLAAVDASNSIFTGLAEDTGDFTAISVSVIVPTICLLTIEQSFDKLNWYFTEQFTVEPDTHRTFQQPIVLEYFRVKLANQGILQTFCHMISSRSQNLTQNVNIRNLTTARDAVVVDTSGTALLVDVSGGLVVTFPAVQDISGSVSVLNFPAVQDISGSVTIPHLDKTLDSVDISGQSVIVPHLNKTLDSVDISGQTMIINRTASSITTFENPASIISFSIITTLAPQQVKGSAGNLVSLNYYNDSNAINYLLFYDALAANVVIGTTPIVFTLALKKADSSHVEFHRTPFSTAISFVASSASDGSAAPSGTGVFVTALYN
jgi:hypothetical protein